MVKPGGLLERAMQLGKSKICQACANLVKVSDNALGCVVHDKFIFPEYPPYHGNMECEDWTSKVEQ